MLSPKEIEVESAANRVETWPVHELYIDVDEAAKFLNKDRRTILRWARENLVPVHTLRVGGRAC